MRQIRSAEYLIVFLLAIAAFSVSFASLRMFRAAGIQPSFYQSNFEPAVMMTCGKGFMTATTATAPPELVEFLQLRRSQLDCAILRPVVAQSQVTWNATWYYLYAATAVVWKVTGISWTALDGLVAGFAAVVSMSLYGLFRLISNRWLAIPATLLLLFSPVNLSQLLFLRDYSKAPFVLLAILLLAWLVQHPRSSRSTLWLSAAFGAVVGLGYGFRSDLAVMMPFGLFVSLFLMPGAWRANLGRNLAAVALMSATFAIVAWPALSGLSRGGCQFHYALLGMTRPLVNELGMATPLYQFGGHFLDTFVDLKVGDYAHRVMDMPVPLLCAPEYDVASGRLFKDIALTFPGDIVAHAYGSVVMILRAGLLIPAMSQPSAPFPELQIPFLVYRLVEAVTVRLAPLGLVVTAIAVGLAWRRSIRLGITLTIFILFLTGYPAIEFEARHWFHLRFIPWWCALLVFTELVLHRSPWTRSQAKRALAGTVGLGAVMLGALFAIRAIQTRSVNELIERYLAAPAEPVAFAPHARGVSVAWQPQNYATPPATRASDLLVLELEPSACSGTGALTVKTKYNADLPSHDLSTVIDVPRPEGGAARTRVFVPVFWQGIGESDYLRFSGFEIDGAAPSCISSVARVTTPTQPSLWMELVVPPDWSSRRLFQSIRGPALLRSFFPGPFL